MNAVALPGHILDRLMARIEKLSQIGDVAGIGMWRRPYTKAERDVHEVVAEWMREAGLSTRYDAVGNLFGRWEADHGMPGPVVMTGSHLDTVKNGGRFDGVLGVLGALAAVEQLVEAGYVPSKPVEVAALVGEEGSRFPTALIGSRAMTGNLLSGDLERTDEEGVTLREALLAAGYDPERVTDAQRDDVAAFLEIHIEQGRVLESQDMAVGIVSAIVGMHQIAVELTGRADHAGTTPIPLRNDALVAAARMICEMTDRVERDGSVVTVGRMEVEPGATNIVPSSARFTIDFRHADPDRRVALAAWLEETCRRVATDAGVDIIWDVFHRQEPVAMDPHIRAALAEAAAELGERVGDLVSGAGHDAMVAAQMYPTAMLFVRSKDGRSHAPEEESSREDIGIAVSILARTLAALA